MSKVIATDFPANAVYSVPQAGAMRVEVELTQSQRLEMLLASLCAMKQAKDDIHAAIAGAFDELQIEVMA